jgi:F-type H+/Na+-transporting ATPase subunit alpha
MKASVFLFSTVTKKNSKAVSLLKNYGFIETVGAGIAQVKGLFNVKAGELVRIYPFNILALALNLGENRVGLVLCGSERFVNQNDIVSITGKLISISINPKILGTVIDPLGFNLMTNQVLSGKNTVTVPVEQGAPDIISRQPIFEPLLTGLTVIDSLVPIGRGQRELIIGDRQTGKTSITIDAILNQTNVICVYVSIGQKCSGIAQIFRTLKKANKTKNLVIVCATASDAAPLQYLAPYSGCAVAEYFRDTFGDATLVIYDDLSKQATAYRQMSLLLRRPPGREAFPGDVFYLHSRLLERAAKLTTSLGGGSLTALPIVETQAGDVSAYIPTNVISITDGQVFLDAELFTQGVRPAVNVGLSVSRVGSAAQYPSMKALAGKIKLELAQYREMLGFTKFGSDIDPATARLLHRGERLVEILKQPNSQPNIIELQILLIGFGTLGILDHVELKNVKLLIFFGSLMINFMFSNKIVSLLTYFFRYLNANQLNDIISNLLKFVFTKTNKINLNKKN